MLQSKADKNKHINSYVIDPKCLYTFLNCANVICLPCSIRLLLLLPAKSTLKDTCIQMKLPIKLHD